MTDLKDPPPDFIDLRRRAEERLKMAISTEDLSPAEAAHLIHELQVHQIELEMQNEELRLSQARLEESRSKYADLYDFAPVGYLTLNEAGRIVEANLTAATLLGVERGRLLTRFFSHFLAESDRWVFLQLLNNNYQQRERRREFHLQDGSGNVRTMLLDIVFLRDAEGRERHRLAMTDITELKRIQEELRLHKEDLEELVAERTAELFKVNEQLREANEKLRALFEFSPLTTLHLDNQGTVLSWNPAAERMFGWSAAEVVGGPLPMVPEEKWEESSIIIHRIRQGEQVTGLEIRGQRRDGTWIDLSLSIAPIRDAQGKVCGMVDIVEDITARKLAEEALHQKEEQLRKMQKLEAIGQLAGGVAHDFNNLLTGIMGYADLLLLGQDPSDPLCHYVKEIAHTANRAASLTRQLLAFGRRQVLQPQPLNLNSLIDNMHHLLRRTVREDVELAISLASELGTVRADPGQMEQVLLNLAINAGDSMPQGGTLAIATANLDLDEDFASRHPEIAAGPYVTLSVSDTGTGMDQETLSRIFEPFFTTKQLGRGTGLGLATVFGIVKQSGGHILCTSRPGQGTTFTVCLPRITETQEQASPVPQHLEAARGSETILVVEDAEVVRRVTSQVLQSRGYTVIEAADGWEALALGEQYPGPIHLLLTDVIMPGINGLEVAERWLARRPATRVIFMSGYSEDLMGHPEHMRNGVCFLQKPFTTALLARKVREALDE